MIEYLKAQKFILESELKYSSGYIANTGLNIRCLILRNMIADIDAKIEELS